MSVTFLGTKKIIQGTTSLQGLNDILSYYNTNCHNYTLIKRGSVRDIVFADSNIIRRYVINSGSRFEGVHLIRMVYLEIEKRIISGEYVLPNIEIQNEAGVYSFYSEQGLKNCLERGGEVVGIDINSCYWNTLYKIGAISEILYLKGFKKQKEWKIARNASVGSLGQNVVSIEFVNGKRKSPIIKEHKYKNVRLSVIYTIYNIALEMARELGNDFCFFFTDCFFVTPDKVDFVKQKLLSYGYESKQSQEVITQIDNNSTNVSFLWREGKRVFFSKNQEVNGLEFINK